MDNIAKSECGRVHGPSWLKWLGHLKGTPAIGLEIGTFEGDSAEWWNDNIGNHPNAHYYCIDPFTGAADHRFHNIDCTHTEEKARAKLARFPSVTILKGYSEAVLRCEPSLQLLAGKIQSAYIDGSHTSRDTLRDAVLTFDLMAVGGTMIFDDYEWTHMPNPIDRPKIGIDAFLAAYAKQIEVLSPRGWQLAVRKVAE